MSTPKDQLKKWVELFNQGNAEAIAECYTDDAINHQITQAPVKGKKDICTMFKNEFDAANMTCIIENIFKDGNWGILEWKDPLGLRGCGFFQFENGLIKFQRGYWDQLSLFRIHQLPIPSE